MLLPIAPMLLPPIANGMLQSVIALGPIAAAAAETCFVAGSIYGALPFAIAVFPQEMKIDVDVLEDEFKSKLDKSGQPIVKGAEMLPLGAKWDLTPSMHRVTTDVDCHGVHGREDDELHPVLPIPNCLEIASQALDELALAMPWRRMEQC